MNKIGFLFSKRTRSANSEVFEKSPPSLISPKKNYKVSRMDDYGLKPKPYDTYDNEDPHRMEEHKETMDLKLFPETDGDYDIDYYNMMMIYHGKYFKRRLRRFGRY